MRRTLSTGLILVSTGVLVSTYSSNLEYLITGIVIYVIGILGLVYVVDRYVDFNDAIGVLMLGCLVTSISSLIGFLISRSMYSFIVSTGIVLSTLTYTVISSWAGSR